MSKNTKEQEIPYSFLNHGKMDEYNINERSAFFERYKKDGYDKFQRRMKRQIILRKCQHMKIKLRQALSKIKRRVKSA